MTTATLSDYEVERTVEIKWPVWSLETTERVKLILLREIDVEIHCRSQELTIIESRIKELEVLIGSMENHCWSYNPKYLEGISNVNNFQSDFHNGIQESGVPTPKRKRRRKLNEMNSESIERKLYAKALDGSFAQIICPACEREHFANSLGFMNHCRIIHDVKFPSFSEACLHCGIPVEESEVPLNDPGRLKAINFVLSRKLKKQKTEKEKNRETEKLEVKSESESESQSIIPNETASFPLNEIILKPSTPFKTIGKQPRNELKSSENQKQHETGHHSESNGINNNLNNEQNEEAADCISRFYIKKKIIVGNVSRSISAKSRENGDESTHKWMVYVRGTKEEPNISQFVKTVRFFLDPSYQPNHIIEVSSHPFSIARRGWGEFPIRVQLNFVDTRNKSVSIIHPIKLTNKMTGLQYDGGETAYDIELDKRFFDENNIPYFQPSSLPSPSITSSTGSSPPKKNRSRKPHLSMLQRENMKVFTSQMEIILNEVVKLFPLILQRSSRMKSELPQLLYNPAPTIDKWNCWSKSKRKAVEWIRARQIRLHALKIHNSLSTSDLTTKTVLMWCRSNLESHLLLKLQASPKNSHSRENLNSLTLSPNDIMQDENLKDVEERDKVIDRLIDEAMGIDHWEGEKELDIENGDLEKIPLIAFQSKEGVTEEQKSSSFGDIEAEIDEDAEIDILD